jgi:hypothetical protein
MAMEPMERKKEKRNNFAEEIFQFKPFFFEKTQFEKLIFLQQKRSFLFSVSFFSRSHMRK